MFRVFLRKSCKKSGKPSLQKNPVLKSKFLFGRIDKKKTDWRKCVKCAVKIKCKNSVTSPLLRHIQKCPGRVQALVDHSLLKLMTGNAEKFEMACKLVYKDNISINKVCNSEQFKELFKVHTYSVARRSFSSALLMPC